MPQITALVAILKPFRELIVIVVALSSAGYAAITYFATAAQLADAKSELQRLQTTQHGVALTALQELKCNNRLNRELLRAELEEFRLTVLLQKTITDAAAIRSQGGPSVQNVLDSLSSNRDALAFQLQAAGQRKSAALRDLRDNSCSATT
ncbi:MAG: hypothetical protein BM562_16065 [Alphaproteobacteria bacterium MedPE-SWcel]|nr:MAG: hypothetical protein BM562_16065 [Alphaproteobacteria bacterium MedPE-SWcel]